MDTLEEICTHDHEMTAAVRYEKVEMARRRLAEGGYDGEEFLDRVLDAILSDMAS
jgi:hypothetical protein